MKRVAQVLKVKPEHREEYERIHAQVWPTVLEILSAHHVSNYSIYRYGDLLISYLEYVGDDFDADMAAIAAEPETQRWWDVCIPMQEQVAEAGEDQWWHEVPEVFHLD